MKKKSNLVLIGMPGAGKSTIGVLLAKCLGKRFIDTDLLIQEREGRLLRTIISEEGPERFKQIENEVNASLEAEDAVIAPGGSVIYGEQAMKHLKEIAVLVYLRLPYRTVAERLGNLTKRGVVLEPGQTLQSLYEERCPLYEKYADEIIDCDGMELGKTLECIRNKTENTLQKSAKGL